MIKTTTFIVIFLFSGSVFAQTTFLDTITSDFLNENRKLRIHLPKTFNKSDNKTYPLILTMDGEYMFYNIIGNTELLLVTDKIPEVVVVGINQNYADTNQTFARYNDCNYDSKTGLPIKKGIVFFKFITNELIPYLETNYKIGKFKTICGHSFTANYINYFLLDEKPLFNGYISISPYIPKPLVKNLYKELEENNDWLFYYLSTSENDLSGHKSSIQELDSLLFRKITNHKFQYTFNNFDKETHFSLVSRCLPLAIKSVFSIYAPIRDEEIEQEKELVNFLLKKYDKIQKIYGINLAIREDDLTAISWVAEDNEDWTSLKKIGKLTVSLFPDIADGYYMLALCEEKASHLETALILYKKGYSKLGKEVLNKSDFYEDIERIEKLLSNKIKN